MKKIELLATAGSHLCLKTAINAGADAVYIGGEKYGARAFAESSKENNIVDAIKYTHSFGKKIYITINTLFKNEELKPLLVYVDEIYNAGADAVIVQDLGALKLIRERYNDLEIHASTQMGITSVYGV